MVNVGLIGTGYIGPIHLNALARIGGVKVKRVADVNGELARKAAADYNIEQSGTDWREVVRDPGIDVIHNCTPNKYHFEINKEALNQGKQVFTEKPLCMDLKEADELVNLAEKKKAVTGIGFCYRYFPAVQEMAARVRRGDAGAVRLVTGTYFQDWLSRETDWTWRLLASESGESNITADLGSHWFDLVQFATGLEVRQVIGDLATLIPVRKRPKRQVLAFEKVERCGDRGGEGRAGGLLGGAVPPVQRRPRVLHHQPGLRRAASRTPSSRSTAARPPTPGTTRRPRCCGSGTGKSPTRS